VLTRVWAHQDEQWQSEKAVIASLCRLGCEPQNFGQVSKGLASSSSWNARRRRARSFLSDDGWTPSSRRSERRCERRTEAREANDRREVFEFSFGVEAMRYSRSYGNGAKAREAGEASLSSASQRELGGELGDSSAVETDASGW
jgi:hypothetical protein